MEDVVVLGLGQMGAVFAHGALRMGARVTPWVRGQAAADVLATTPAPRSVVVAVGEGELPDVLAQLPPEYRGRALLLQNELLPYVWETQALERPTVAVVWFEKKANTGIRPIRSTPIAGPEQQLWLTALEGIGVPAHAVSDDALLFELAAKNVYILTANVAGLLVGGSVGQLLSEHRALAESVAREVVAVQSALAGHALDFDALWAHFEESVACDPEHGCRGRTSASRLDRLQHHAREHGLETPQLDRIAALC